MVLAFQRFGKKIENIYVPFIVHFFFFSEKHLRCAMPPGRGQGAMLWASKLSGGDWTQCSPFTIVWISNTQVSFPQHRNSCRGKKKISIPFCIDLWEGSTRWTLERQPTSHRYTHFLLLLILLAKFWLPFWGLFMMSHSLSFTTSLSTFINDSWYALWTISVASDKSHNKSE